MGRAGQLKGGDKVAGCLQSPPHLEEKKNLMIMSKPVLLIWIRIRMFSGLPDLDPLVHGSDPDQAKRVKKTLIPTAL
jgi:hypothetical protein